MKLPDFFYIKQTRALNNLHAASVELVARLYSRANSVDAYDSDWGQRQLRNLTTVIEIELEALGKERTARLLRHRITPLGLTQRPELDRDVIRLEAVQDNIEYELGQLLAKKCTLIGWIQAALLLALLAGQLIKLIFP